MITIVNGDLFNAPKSQIICHQVNCQGKMGRGIATHFKNKYPDMYDNYVQLCEFTHMLGQVYCYEDKNHGRFIANLFMQDFYGRDKRYTDYNAMANCFEKMAVFAKNHSLSLATPYKIGCNNAGGNWKIVYTIIEETCKDIDVYIYDKKGESML